MTNQQLEAMNEPLGRIQEKLNELMEELEIAMLDNGVTYVSDPLLQKVSQKMADAANLIDKVYSID